MSLKTIVLVIQNIEEAGRLAKAAAIIARKHNSHLIGLHVAETMLLVSEAAYLPISMQDQLSEQQTKAAREIEQVFTDISSKETFASEFRFEKINSSTASDHIIEQARCADLVVMGQQRPEAKDAGPAITVERTIRKSGRPVLVLPYIGNFENFGHSILIGWSPTSQATRAVHDAIPLIDEGADVHILTIRDGGEVNSAFSTAKELARTYDRHGIKAEVIYRAVDDLAIGDVLLNEAFERGVDMIVTGAFGHSRLYDFVIGATTTKLLDSMTAPVLFSS